jgi:hypothetical protein
MRSIKKKHFGALVGSLLVILIVMVAPPTAEASPEAGHIHEAVMDIGPDILVIDFAECLEETLFDIDIEFGIAYSDPIHCNDAEWSGPFGDLLVDILCDFHWANLPISTITLMGEECAGHFSLDSYLCNFLIQNNYYPTGSATTSNAEFHFATGLWHVIANGSTCPSVLAAAVMSALLGDGVFSQTLWEMLFD